MILVLANSRDLPARRLVETWRAHDARQRCIELPLHVHAAAQLRRRHVQHVLEQRPQIGGLACGAASVREAAHAAHDLRGAIDAFDRLLEQGVDVAQQLRLSGIRGKHPQLLPDRLELGEVRAHERERIVDLVRDPGRQLVDTREPRRRVELAAQVGHFAQVTHPEHASGSGGARVGEWRRAHRDRDQRPGRRAQLAALRLIVLTGNWKS